MQQTKLVAAVSPFPGLFQISIIRCFQKLAGPFVDKWPTLNCAYTECVRRQHNIYAACAAYAAAFAAYGTYAVYVPYTAYAAYAAYAALVRSESA